MEPTDFEISPRLSSITAAWFGHQYGPSWKVRLSSRPWRIEEGGEIEEAVVLSDDESWKGIRRLPKIPDCALPVPTKSIFGTHKEAETVLNSAWGAHWPIRGTLPLWVARETPLEFQFSLTYDLEILEKPNLDNLWVAWWQTEERDQISIPPAILRDWKEYVPICQKISQSILAIWRQRLIDGPHLFQKTQGPLRLCHIGPMLS
jgi:hypothetical protein